MSKTKKCTKCFQIKEIDQFYARKSSKTGFRNDCKDCSKNRVKNWTEANKSKVRKYKADYYEENKEQININVEIYRKNNIETIRKKDRLRMQKRCRKSENLRLRKYRQKYPERVNALSAEYRRKKKISKLYKEFKFDIREIYQNCPEDHQVDHIIPITHKNVCGLHVPWNLQYLTCEENKKKGNKFDGTNENKLWSQACLRRS